MKFLKRYQDQIYAAMRIVVGFLFVSHGIQKVLTAFSGELPMQMPALIFYPAAAIETVGGALIMLGLFTPWAAFVCSGQMAVAYFIAHQPQGIIPLLNRGDSAVLFCWIFLLMAARGAGIWSLDHLRGAASGGATD